MKNNTLLQKIEQTRITKLQNAPAKAEVASFVERILTFLFPTDSSLSSEESYREVYSQLCALLRPLMENVEVEAGRFWDSLSTIYDTLLADAQATLAGDPAATSLTEIILAYPGFLATAVYRVAHQLHGQRVPLLPRLLSQYAHAQTGIDIHPTAQIGDCFVIDHGTGVVIGATAQIGNNVTLYHGVTLGALRVEKGLAGVKRHPTVEDHVTIYANATILGGSTVVGRHAIVGANAWVIRSVPSFSSVVQEGKRPFHTPRPSVRPSAMLKSHWQHQTINFGY